MTLKVFLLCSLLVIGAASLLWSCITPPVESPPYSVIESEGPIELREYGRLLIAEVSVEGERKQAITQGFRVIADYIFGKNMGSKKIAMTAPVVQEGGSKGEKIAMSAPVVQEGTGDEWRVYFIMPSEYTLSTLPKPLNPDITLRELPSKRVISIQFTGNANAELIRRKETELREYIMDQGLKIKEPASYAFYDPPWTLPFLRRNEISFTLIESN